MAADTTSHGEQLRTTLDAFRRIVQALRNATRDTERRFGLSAAQLFALHQLSTAPGASVNDLAALTFTHQSSVSVVVARLVKRRLVAKVPAATDRRRVQLAVTDAGRALLRRAPEPVQDRLIAAVAALGQAERRTLAAALARVAETLATGGGPAPMFFEEQPRRRGRRAPARGRPAR